VSGGLLYVVALPIGNAEDVSARALRVLAEVDLVACEDTRRAGRLLAAHSIGTRTVSYFEHNESRRTAELLAKLHAGATIALITDAGTPAISDPGYRLVRAAIEAGIRVTAVPGPSAAIAALSIAGLPTDRFVFEGFLPVKSSERRRVLEDLAREQRTIICFEAARRLSDSLSEMAEIFGRDRRVAIIRELTKIHEEVTRGTVEQMATRFAANEVLGEVTIVVEGVQRTAEGDTKTPAGFDETAALRLLREAGLTLKQASRLVSRLTGASQRDIYQRAVAAPKPFSKEEAPDE
jgi:16S rRNA (cytidine1402-2'-O)-methyltransferase